MVQRLRIGQGAEGAVVLWSIRLVATAIATVPAYAMGRTLMWMLMSRTQYEQVLIAGHRYSVWLGGWALLAGAGFLIGLWTKGSISKAVAAGCFGCLLGFWAIGVGIGTGATAEVTMTAEDRQEALQDAKVTSHPQFWQFCCLRR